MDKAHITALVGVAKSAIDSGHNPADAFALVSGLFNIMVPVPTAAVSVPVAGVLMQRAQPPAGFLGAIEAQNPEKV